MSCSGGEGSVRGVSVCVNPLLICRIHADQELVHVGVEDLLHIGGVIAESFFGTAGGLVSQIPGTDSHAGSVVFPELRRGIVEVMPCRLEGEVNVSAPCAGMNLTHTVAEHAAGGLFRDPLHVEADHGDFLHPLHSRVRSLDAVAAAVEEGEAHIALVHAVDEGDWVICTAADAVVAEGFEAGGHNGREETTTLCLIPSVRKATTLPLIAAGGVATGSGMAATFSLGAEGVQIGTRFAMTEESSASEEFKTLCRALNEGDTKLMLKQLAPTRLIKNNFYKQVEEAELSGASVEELKELLGKGRAKKGIFEGDLEEGELEIGQVASLISEPETAQQAVEDIVTEFNETIKRVSEVMF